MNKVTMQEIADELGVSRVTVWKAINNKNGVSPKTQQRVLEAQERLNTILTVKSSPIVTFDDIKNISIAVARLDTSFFWGSIVNSIAKELQANHVNLVLTPIPTNGDSKENRKTLQSVIENSNIDGMIIINLYDKESIDFMSSINIPKIYMDTLPDKTPEDLLGDVFIIEGTTSLRAITNRVLEKGFHRVGYLGDINYAKSNIARFNGFQKGLGDHGISFSEVEKYSLTNAYESFDYDKAVNDHINFLLAENSLPDAFICENDYVADIALRRLATSNVQIHQDIQITGFDNCPDFFRSTPPSATVNVDTEMIGKQLLYQLLFRIRHPETDYSDISLHPKVMFFNKLA